MSDLQKKYDELEKKYAEATKELEVTKSRLVRSSQYKDFVSIDSISAAMCADNDFAQALIKASDKIGELSIKRGQLQGRLAVLENEKKIVEAQIAMSDEFAYLKNVQARDAMRRDSSSSEREKIAEVTQEIQIIDGELFKAREEKSTLLTLIDGPRNKIKLCIAIFNYIK